MNIRILLYPLVFALLLIGACSDASDSKPVEAVDVLTTPVSDCFWYQQGIPSQKESDNNTWRDLYAAYATALYFLPEQGDYITLENEFPYSRYMSIVSYHAVGGLIDTLIDRDILPNTGSSNPFVAGNTRNDPSRIYSLTIKIGDPAGDADPVNTNILYADEFGVLTYRIYLPNGGADSWGDVSLPRVTLHRTDGSIVQGDEACAALKVPTAIAVESNAGGNLWYTETEYAELRESSDPSKNPPVFRATYNFPFHKQCDFGGDCSSVPFVGLRYPFPDPRYLYSFINRKHGEVLVLRGKLPETPQTYSGNDDTFMDEQLRFWSICNYEYFSTRAEACLFDEQVQVNEDGFYTIVISRQEDIPTNATSDCGVNHLAWSENGDGLGIVEGRENYPDDGFLLIRNIVPSPDFAQAVPNPDSLGEEANIMGDYLTKGRYFTKAEFEGLGCNPWLAIPYNGIE